MSKTAQKNHAFILDESAEVHPDSIALISDNLLIRYGEFLQIVVEVQEKVKDIGIKKGDLAAIVGSNSCESVILLMALLRGGIVAVPVNAKYPAPYLASMMNNINCKNILLAPGRYGSAKDARIFSDTSDTGAFKTIPFESLVMGLDKRTGNDSVSPSSGLYEDIGNTPALDDDATILHSSGSSGKPKAVLHTYGNHYYSALGANENVSFGPGDKWLLSLSLHHVGGYAILIRAATSSGAVVVPPRTMPLDGAIERFRPTHLSLVSTQLLRLFRNRKCVRQLKKAKAIVLGGGMIDPAIIRKSIDIGLPLCTSYGSTETASQIAATRNRDKPDKLYTSGKSLKGSQLKTDRNNEILVRGKTLCRGYIMDGKLHKVTDNHGWYKTGDIGEFDDEGYLKVVKRKDTMFQSGGENIYPEEIEEILCEYDTVLRAVVVPVPDEEFGTSPAAFIKTENNVKIDNDELKIFFKERLPAHKFPKHILPWHDYLDVVSDKTERKSFQKYAVDLLFGREEQG